MIHKLLNHFHHLYSYHFNDYVPTRWLVQQNCPYSVTLLPTSEIGKLTKYIALQYYHNKLSIAELSVRYKVTHERIRLHLWKATRTMYKIGAE